MSKVEACGRGICAANEGHDGTCAEASGWDETEPDMVNKPAHYRGHPKKIECIDVIEDNPYPNLANVIKYAWRVSWGGKSDDMEDLRKLVWYGQREIQRRGGKRD